MKRELWSVFALSGALSGAFLLGSDLAPNPESTGAGRTQEQIAPAVGCAVLAMDAGSEGLIVQTRLKGFEPRHIAGKVNLWFDFPDGSHRVAVDGSPLKVSQGPDGSLDITSTHKINFGPSVDGQAVSSSVVETIPGRDQIYSSVSCNNYRQVTFEQGVPVNATPYTR